MKTVATSNTVKTAVSKSYRRSPGGLLVKSSEDPESFQNINHPSVASILYSSQDDNDGTRTTSSRLRRRECYMYVHSDTTTHSRTIQILGLLMCFCQTFTVRLGIVMNKQSCSFHEHEHMLSFVTFKRFAFPDTQEILYVHL